MPSFEEIGLRSELLRTLEEEEIERPTALQEAVIPALRRGGNLVARASTGSGKTLAYGLGILDRLKPRDVEEDEDAATVPLRLLILSPTREAAERSALALSSYAQSVGFAVAVSGGAWGTHIDAAEVLVGTPGQVMDAVRSSSLKLEQLEAVVIDGASTVAALGEWEAADALLDLVPRDAQRVVISAALPEEVEDLVERRVKRAIRYPAEPAIAAEGPPPPLEGQVGYVLLSERQKLEVLARQLTSPKESGTPPILFLGSDERAALLAEQLSVRGFLVGAIDDGEADVAVVSSDTTRAELLEDAEGALGQTISFEVPPDAATLLARHRGDDDAVVLVEPRELAHLQEIARMARLRARPLPLPVEGGGAASDLASFRDSLRRALREEDLTSQLLVLEPLLEQYSAHEVAAAATALLLRRQPPVPAPAAGQAAAPAGPSASAASRAPAAGAPPAVWARLYVGVGSRDDVRAGDLVGALAGEADIRGAQIGRIEIRDSFSIVEVEAAVADRVIRSVNGTTLKGRSVRVDYDRSADRARRGAPQSERPGAQRRANRRPPRVE
jgi:ATP-dependent RNA helicase DeaD